MTKRKMNEEEAVGESEDSHDSKKQNPTPVSTSGESSKTQENTTNVQNDCGKLVFTKVLCETDVGYSFTVSIPKKDAEDHFPILAPGKSKFLEFEDTRGNNFRMEFMHSNFGGYYLRIGWDRYRNEHKLEEGDLLFVYKKEKGKRFDDDDQQYFYVIECQKDPGKRESRKQNPTPVSTSGENNTKVKLVFTKYLCETDVGESFSVSIPKEDAEDYLPSLAPGNFKMLEFKDTRGDNFSMEFVCSNLGDYYFSTGWERYRNEHNLGYDDMLSVYKIEKQHGVDDDQRYFYIIEGQKVTPEHPTKLFLTHVKLVLSKLLAALEDPTSSMKKETVLAKLLSDQDLNGNSKGLQLEKKEVRENLNERPLLPIGQKITLPLFDPIGKKLYQMEMVYTDEEEYYIGLGWNEYAAAHNLLTFDTIFVNKIIVNGDAVNPRSARFIWDKDIDDDQLVNNSYYYEIIYQKVSTPPSSNSATG